MKINAYKVKLAQIFLNRLKKELHKIKSKEELILETYSKGVEQGYCLKIVDAKRDAWGCAFSLSQSGNQLVVYIGVSSSCYLPFLQQGNVPLEGRTTALYYATDEFGLRLAVTNTICSLVMALEGKKQPEAVS
jgi:hypothetical protein